MNNFKKYLLYFMIALFIILFGVASSSAGTSARDYKQLARDNVATSIPVGNKEQAAALDKAIAHLDESLAPALWLDNDHLVKAGGKVFDEEKEAAHSIIECLADEANNRHISSVRSVSVPALTDALGYLVCADSVLAMTALNDLIIRCRDRKCEEHIEHARHYLDELQKLPEPDREKEMKQIEVYKKVWRQAKEGMEITLTGDVQDPEGSPLQWTIRQNYPNPFNPRTVISYSIPVRSFVSIKVFNLLGQEVGLLVDEEKQEGSYSVEWNGERYPSGVYFYRFQAGAHSETRRLLLLK